MDDVVRAKRKPYIPVVLSRQEIDHILGKLKMPYRLIISLMYGCGHEHLNLVKLRIDLMCLLWSYWDTYYRVSRG